MIFTSFRVKLQGTQHYSFDKNDTELRRHHRLDPRHLKLHSKRVKTVKLDITSVIEMKLNKIYYEIHTIESKQRESIIRIIVK